MVSLLSIMSVRRNKPPVSILRAPRKIRVKHCFDLRLFSFSRFSITVTLYTLVWLGGAVVRALDLRLEVAGSFPAAALSSATLDKLFTHNVQRLWCYNLMAL